MEPPQFQESLQCEVCKCSFNTFRRRHHCRCCGRTFCAEHSSNQMALPQFGVYSCVRVCSDCFSYDSRSGNNGAPASLDGVDHVTDTVSRLDIGAVSDSDPKLTAEPTAGTVECKCGMPLCICKAPALSTVAVTLQNKVKANSTAQTNPKPKKTEIIPKKIGSTSNNKQFMNFNSGQVTNSSLENFHMDYEVNGEGLREAIKNGDTSAVRELLSKGVDANYCDKQGLSLLHLAAVFNRTDIAFALMDSGASLDHRNSQGETPMDCAPATLQYKMQQKVQESENLGPRHHI